MDKFDRIQQLHRALKGRRYPISVRELADKLECTERTVQRNLDTLRDLHNAPLQHLPRRGWKYHDPDDTFELVGTWFTSKELVSLVSVIKISNDLDSSFISDELAPIRAQIDSMLQARGISPKAFNDKIKILGTSRQECSSEVFNTLSMGLISGKQISLQYTSFEGQASTRTVSPQQLVYYQENWYLDAYCHLRQELRTFKLSRCGSCALSSGKAKKVSNKELTEHFSESFGIFAGKAKHLAKLAFTGDSAREAAGQTWHPQQVSEWSNSIYTLSIPYNDDRELVRDILKHGSNVEVIGPAKLRNKIINIAASMADLYTG